MYSTFQECLLPPEELLAPKAGDDGPWIDSSSYQAPLPTQSMCPSTRNVRTTQAACPHMQSGLELWEDPNTWRGELPTPGGWVNLPEGVKVLVTACSVNEGDKYAGIVIPEASEVRKNLFAGNGWISENAL